MDSVPAVGELTLLDYLRPVWRFKVIVVLVVALAAAATYWYTNRETKVYQASTQLYVGQSSLQQLLSPTASAPSDRTVADQALLLTTPAIADVVRARLRLPYSTQAILNTVQVAPDSSTDFLTITAQNTNPDLAARLANGFAQAYLVVAGGNLVGGARASLRAAQNELQHLAPGSANGAARLGLRQQIATLEGIIVSPPSVGKQLAPALVPGVPASPKPTRDAIFAAALALILCVIASYLFDRSDRRVHRLGELEELFELPVLATVPHVRHVQPKRDDPYSTPPDLREPFRTLRVNLDLARNEPDAKTIRAKVIMVTSGLPSEGKSTIVRNLAMSYREAGARVAVVEADLRRPVLASQFNIHPTPGLSDVLASGDELRMQRVPSGTEQFNGSAGVIDVAVAGEAQEDPTVLLTDERLRGPIVRLSADYDVVLVDSPPLLSVSDGLPLLGIVDGVLLVVRAGTTTYPAAERLRRTIDRVNRIRSVHVLGVVANDVVDELASYYNYSKAGGASSERSVAATADSAAS